MKKKMLVASTVALSLAPVLATKAEEVSWTARTVDQIQNDVTQNGNKVTYTIQYGDTLSTIAEALGVDVNVLANLNKITNMDLIFPETVLTTTVNENEEVTDIEIETPETIEGGDSQKARADLETNQIIVNDQTVQVDDLSQPVEGEGTVVETVAPQTEVGPVTESTTEVAVPVEETMSEANSEATEPVLEAPVVEKTRSSVEAEGVAASDLAETTSVSEPEVVTYQAEASTSSGLHPLVVTAQEIAETTGKVLPLILWFQKAQLLETKLQIMLSKIWLAVASTTSSGNNDFMHHMIVNTDQPTPGIQCQIVGVSPKTTMTTFTYL